MTCLTPFLVNKFRKKPCGKCVHMAFLFSLIFSHATLLWVYTYLYRLLPYICRAVKNSYPHSSGNAKQKGGSFHGRSADDGIDHPQRSSKQFCLGTVNAGASFGNRHLSFSADQIFSADQVWTNDPMYGRLSFC